MPKLSFRRQGHALYPSDDFTTEWLESVQKNVDVIGDLRVPRHARNHRHLFAILNEATKNIDGFASTEDLLEFLKLEAGMYKIRAHHTVLDHLRILREAWSRRKEFSRDDNSGYSPVERAILWIVEAFKDVRFKKQVEVITYESLNFESMDEVRFRRVKERFLWILQDKFGFEPHELEERALSQLAAYGAESKRERR